ncbi:monocarboxylate transporter 9-like [Pectinophora gossypiella]|uniref:monocarboxylate transporter 9-like n=1 Tax=Pectinophora gossypiella TaxID=13191 RepID=UPI00214E2E81|nr:monocarboxylate transporter 9-like [Pectinophora gossypiella]
MSGANKVPPDGGYGWVITLAYALNNVVVLPLIAGFGLVFQEAFSDTGLSATQGTLIITLNHGIGMLLSFFSGPVLRRFSYRKVAVTGALLIAIGLIITAFASNFWLFILSYSIINSMGIAAVMAAFALAINSFFKEKRARAIGAAMSLTGLGAILMPLLMSALMSAYGWRYAVLILGAICLHSLVGACLLRPAKWYLKEPVVEQELEPLNKDVELINGSVTTSSKANGISSLPRLEESIENGIPAPKSISMRSLSSSASLETRNAISHPDIRRKSPEPPLSESRYKWWESQEINLGSSINIFNEPELKKKEKEITHKEKDENENKTLFQKFVAFFDLTLLTDPIFVNILVGLSLASCVETNFSLLLPIILNDMMKFQTEDIAKIMAVIGFSDTLFRFVSPFIGEWCNKPPRVMYLISLLLVIFTRTMMLFTSSFVGMLLVALALGITKGVRTVYMNIVIPNHVPLERLPFASGIQMFFNGIIIITIGSLLGRLREASGSYQIPIIVLNVVTMVTVVLWCTEFMYFRMKNRNVAENTGNV